MASPTTATSARPFTHEDLQGLPDDGYRREIIGGSLIVTPSPNLSHQRAALAIARRLHDAQPDELETVIAPFDVRAPGEDVVVPDVIVIRRDDVQDDRMPQGAVPLLVVEVLSPSNRRYDPLTKRALYQEAGVASYWIVDPTVPSLLALRLDAGGTYETGAEVAGDSAFATDVPFPVTVAPADLVR